MKRSQKPEYDGRWTMDDGRTSLVSRLSSLVSRILVLIYFICLLSANCYAQSISSAELINNAKQYDGKVVVYEGEVVGEVMSRGDYAWLNIYDGNNAIGIWSHKNLIRDIVYAGSYKSKGDRVAVTGVFRQNCLQHGGDLDIHAQAMRKISCGKITQERANLFKSDQAIILGVLCLLLLILRLLRHR